MITIQLFPETFIILYGVIFVITCLIYKIKRNKSLNLFFVGIIELYILLVLSVTLLPLRIIPAELRQETCNYIYFFQLIPFVTIKEVFRFSGFFSIQLFGNIVLTIPMPILLGYATKEKKGIRLFTKSCVIPIGIEVTQLIIDFIVQYPSRFFDVDDIILNVCGIFIGTIIYIIMRHFKRLYDWIESNMVRV